MERARGFGDRVREVMAERDQWEGGERMSGEQGRPKRVESERIHRTANSTS